MSDAAVQAILHEISPKNAPVLHLLNRYQSPHHLPLWRQRPDLYRAFGRRLIQQGNPGPALELVREGLQPENHPDDADLLFLEALALSRSGNVSRTEQKVTTLLRREDLPARLQVEALSLYGRALKDRFERARAADERTALALKSAVQYEQAFLLTRDPFPGVNAATMYRLAGDAERAAGLAGEVLERAQARLDAPGGREDYWLQATIGEANLLRGDLEVARERYRRAVALAGKNYGDIARMRHQLKLLRAAVPAVGDLLALFHVGTVVAFAGHRIDDPEEAPGQVRFPLSKDLEAEVRRAIRHELDNLDAVVGYAAPSCGADLLFAELMLERGGELHLVLPFASDDFFRTRVDYGRPEMAGWRARCGAVLEAAARNDAVHYAIREEYLDDMVLFEFASTFMQGLALSRARQVGGEARALLVLDPSTARAQSGTELFRQRWLAAGQSEPRVIDLAGLRARAGLPAGEEPWVELPPVASRPHRREVRAMLFADVKNFSKLPERRAPDFFLAFLQQVSRVIEEGSAKPVFSNTWGDGLYVVMEDVRSCADFAIRLLEELDRLDWTSLGLPGDTGVRVGVHTGPVFRGRDPIIDRDNYFGSHVSRAARIEPVTPPGCAFASEQFAASLAVEAPDEFVCEYLGVLELPKGFDRCPLYRLMRT